MAGIGDFTAWWDNERSALRKKLARAVEAARHDPKGAFEEFAKGTRDYGAGRLEGLARAEIPGASFLPRGVIKEALSPSPDSWEQGTDAREVGELVGVPEPGGGQLQEAAKRQVWQRVPRQLESHILADYYTHGDAKEIWNKYGAMVNGKEVYTEIPDSGLITRPWKPGETSAKVGDLIEHPLLAKEYDKRALTPLYDTPVIRQSGYGGAIANAPSSSTDPGRFPMDIRKFYIGEVDEKKTWAHELTHAMESLQSGRFAGTSNSLTLDEIITDKTFNPLGWDKGKINGALQSSDPIVRVYAEQLLNEAYKRYLRHPGETRASLAGGRVRLSDPARVRAYPLEESQFGLGKHYVWSQPNARTFSTDTGADLILKTSKDWKSPEIQLTQAVRDANLDDLVKSARPEKLEDILKELLASP